jgi:formylglycine-generating enzyme required for sulfatase activity
MKSFAGDGGNTEDVDSESDADPAAVEVTYTDLMPNGQGFVELTRGTLELQGAWYWYDSGENVDVRRVYAYRDREMDTEPPDVYWLDKVNDERTEILSKEMLTEKVCVEGSLEGEPQGTLEQYVALGFEVCSTEDDQDPYEFPYPLARCAIGDIAPDERLRTFGGVEFDVHDLDEETLSRIDVQFKEWAALDACQPFCTVVPEGEALGGDEPCEHEWRDGILHVKAHIADAESSNMDARCDIDRVNSSMLQAIHVQVYGGDEAPSIRFCLSDVKAFTAENSPDDIGEIEPVETACGAAGDERAPADFDIDWVTPIDDWGAVAGTDEKEIEPFEIMKNEVTTGQYSVCAETAREGDESMKVCGGPVRDWETCTVYLLRQNELDRSLARRAANCISYCEARNFCGWVGGDLPTEDQWRIAASGTIDFAFLEQPPSGLVGMGCEYVEMNDNESGGVGCGGDRLPATVCSREHVKGNTAALCDMAGNLWEWVLTSDDFDPIDDQDWDADYKMIKGGSMNTTGGDAFNINEFSIEHPTEPHSPTRLGFRCVRPLV